MNETVKTLLSLSLSGTVLILILVLCRPLYRDRISKRWQYYIWLIVIVRLLCPWTLDASPIIDTFRTIFESKETNTSTDVKYIVPDNIRDDLKEIYTNDAFGTASFVGIASKDTETQFVQFLEPLSDITRLIIKKIHIIWLAVALLLFTRKITIYQSFAKYVYASSIPVNNIDMLEHFGNIIEQNNIKGTIGLYVNDIISSPMIIGFFHPRIILTTAVLSSEISFHYTVLHELVHYKRMDMLYKWLVQIVKCLHWFNPFINLMNQEICQECELSCDEMVIKKLNSEEKREYGDTLLNAMKTGGSYKNIPTSVTLNESKELLKGRLEAIMKYREKSKFTKVVTAILTILFCISAVTINVYKTPSAASTSASRIIYENGTYYVMDKGASKSDKPFGGVTDGSVAICLVKKDSYTTVSPFSDITKLVDEVENQCKYMLKQGRYTQDDADILIESAKEIYSIGKSGQKRFPKLNKKSATLKKGGAFSLKVMHTDKTPIWTSNNEDIVAVDKNGRVSARKAGKTKITAKIGRIIYTCKVKVTDKAVKKGYAKDYTKQGITKKGGAYYYKGKRLRIFMDLKADNSFAYFNYDQKGTDDLRVRRAEDDSIVKVEYIAPKEAANILNDMDIMDIMDSVDMVYTSRDNKKDAKPYVKVSRLLKKELPDSIAKVIDSCSSGKWYVVSGSGCKYIYYDGVPHNYAFKPDVDTDSIKINIYDMGSKTGSYVLLAVKQNMPLNIYYNDAKVAYKKINVDTKSV